ncbi:DUF4394 domain-containing protein [Nitrincola nitratireducens]|uniref:DUF4394 domain-containing protein n=1 Tax=Nitrincola nitratireducens TaxID=1229521 RepID=W9VQ19_9GAMM|nr:DUF4394 domain-containing protein [Nitrincola nitratireducens]EXJ12535.1 hypothetical protein D791_00780 [Nitrincola nitratireducens]
MKKTLLSTTIFALLCAPAFAHDIKVTGYALSSDGTSLVSLPGLTEVGETITLSSSLAAIAYRPVTGELIGIAPNAAVYTIDPATGALTATDNLKGDNVGITEGAMVGFDFNNSIDAIRIVATDGSNHVYFPSGFGDNDERANSVRRFTDLFYAQGDKNEGAIPAVFASAYTNAIKGKTASETVQYVLDAETNTLLNLANNAGSLTTVAALTLDGKAVDISAMGDMEIVSPAEGTNMAYAMLMMQSANTSGVYSIDLATGELTLRANLGEMGFKGFAAMLDD